ncbi:hypothetical protein [Qipengyuania sp.]|uniref:hypothetical protein n=1 Tax=Qipengyuania sp. TaxID=2004515 RepID=UPI003AF6C965
MSAEVLDVDAVYAARDPAAVEIEEITVERFGGDMGELLAIAITDRLEEVRLDSRPYFTVKSGSPGGNTYNIYGAAGAPAAEPTPKAATLRGTASEQRSDTRDGEKKVTRCLKRDDRKKCIEETVDVFACRKLTVTLQPVLRLIAREGGTLYAAEDTLLRSQRYCADERGKPSATDMTQSLVDEFAGRVRLDLAPEYRHEEVRIMESRKGLSKADSGAFKDAVRLTKSDQEAACARFAEMLAVYPEHSSVAFNAGLCAEREGRLEDAAGLYGRVMATSEGRDYARAGLDRVDSQIEAERQLERRYAAGRS